MLSTFCFASRKTFAVWQRLSPRWFTWYFLAGKRGNARAELCNDYTSIYIISYPVFSVGIQTRLFTAYQHSVERFNAEVSFRVNVAHVLLWLYVKNLNNALISHYLFQNIIIDLLNMINLINTHIYICRIHFEALRAIL